jgi:hypothetical protein
MEKIDKRPQHKHLPQGYGVRNYVPYQNLNTTQNTAQQTGGQTANTFTPGQTGTQGQLGGLWQSFLSGQIPSSFTNPAAATNAYQSNFQSQVAPQIASQYGAGSPQIASQNALGLSQLQGQLYNTGVGNFMSALGGGSNYALGMPTGSQTGQTGMQTSNQAQTSGINPLAYALMQLL